jgi:hypothetical protein
MTMTRERIQTDNELYAGVLDEGAPGGVWIVVYAPPTFSPVICHLFTNRQAAEAYIYDKSDERPWRSPDDYSLQVWSVSETWPDDKEEN